MRITIDLEEGAKAITGASATASVEQAAEPLADGGAGPGERDGAAGMQSGNDGGAPSEALLQTIAAAEAAGLQAAGSPGDEGPADGGAGPARA